MSAIARVVGRTPSLAKPVLLDYLALAKPRITALVLLVTSTGFYLASPGPLNLGLLAYTLLGTSLVSAGVGALNQVLEREDDARMRRTRQRPLPAGRLTVGESRIFGLVLSALGMAWLLWSVNALTALLALFTWAAYLFVYTPLKRATPLSVVIGAVPGALPVVGGWTAVQGAVSSEAAALFLILFLWQIPHFLSLGWMYRKDYRRAGWPMLPVVDRDGAGTARQALLYVLILLPVSVIPAMQGWLVLAYAPIAAGLGLGFLMASARFAIHRSNSRARQLFHVSLAYLPALFFLMVIAKPPV